MAGPLRLKMQMREAQMRKAKSKPKDHRCIEVRSVEQMQMLRKLGWREAFLAQVYNPDNRTRLAWFVYPNGMRRINMLTI